MNVESIEIKEFSKKLDKIYKQHCNNIESVCTNYYNNICKIYKDYLDNITITYSDYCKYISDISTKNENINKKLQDLQINTKKIFCFKSCKCQLKENKITYGEKFAKCLMFFITTIFCFFKNILFFILDYNKNSGYLFVI